MKIAHPFEVIEGTAGPHQPVTPTHAGIHVAVIMIAVVAAFALGSSDGKVTPAGSATAFAAEPAATPDESPPYFPAQHTNEGVETPAHIEAF